VPASIFNGLFAGRAGVQSLGAGIGVLADNIANSNTIGFKASRAEFADLLAGDLGSSGTGIRIGSGVNLSAVRQVFSQGTFEFTGRNLDVAIDGNGLFIVSDGTENFYTRAGNFTVDPNGNLLNQNGLQVQGFAANGSGTIEALNVNNISQSQISTQNVDVAGNLDASASTVALGSIPDANPGDNDTFADLAALAEFQTFVSVFDSLGNERDVTVFFYKTADSTWQIRGYIDGADSGAVGADAGEAIEIFEQEVTFDSSGNPDGANLNITAANIDWVGSAATQDIDFDFDPITQFASPSNVTSISQDGTGSGSVVSFGVETDGSVFALLDNGQQATVGTLALAIFSNPEALSRRSGSLFVESINSGDPVVGTPSSGRFGAIQTGALELSTSDLAGDFIKLISLQRGFQGSSRIINSIDDLLNELVNII